MKTRKLLKTAMCIKESCLRVDTSSAGQRLDVALAALFPDSGARARRRLWDSHTVLVNGKARPAGCTVYEGDEICVRPQEKQKAEKEAEALPCPQKLERTGERPPCLLTRAGNLLFFYKPAGLHSSRLEGRGGPNLESLLPQLCGPQTGAEAVLLANRLDCGTSGIVAAACDAHSLRQWRRMEDAGLCEKRYLALLHGHLPAAVTVRRELDTAKRRITKVLLTESRDPLRQTRFTPLGYLSSEQVYAMGTAFFGKALPETVLPEELYAQGCTLALCTIAKGARHQIRAHAQYAGFPLWGDALYARTPECPPAHQGGEGFFLHHTALSLPGVRVCCKAVWQSLLPENLQESVNTLV